MLGTPCPNKSTLLDLDPGTNGTVPALFHLTVRVPVPASFCRYPRALPAVRGKLGLNARNSVDFEEEVDPTDLQHAHPYTYGAFKKLSSLCRESTSQARQQTTNIAEQHVPTILPE
jgi:hypothetical protein